MSNIICFSIGTIWTWGKSDNRAELIKYARKLNVDGIELTFAFKKELYGFKMNESQIRWIKKLRYVSLHAPFHLVTKSDNKEEILLQLDKLQEIYDLVNAKNVIIHPDQLPKKELLDRYNMNFCTENLSPKKKIDIRKLEKALEKYPDINLCLDVSHAYLWGENETKRIIDVFGDRIKQVHLSGTFRKKDHLPLHNTSKSFMASIKPLKKIDAPLIIEEDIRIKNIDFVKKEMAFIKDLF